MDRRRWWWRAGWVLVAAGLVAAGWLAWEYVGTTVVAQHRQREIVDDLRAHWREGGGGRGDGRADGVESPWGLAVAIVRIPAFGDDYAVPVLEGAGEEQFATGFGHFPGSAAPGGPGNLVLGGHRITHGEPLRDLPDLRPGDEVLVETRRATYVYTLDSNGLEVDSSDGWPLTSPLVVPPGLTDLRPRGAATITLVTCASLFHTDSRSVAFGHLTGETGPPGTERGARRG